MNKSYKKVLGIVKVVVLVPVVLICWIIGFMIGLCVISVVRGFGDGKGELDD